MPRNKVPLRSNSDALSLSVAPRRSTRRLWRASDIDARSVHSAPVVDEPSQRAADKPPQAAKRETDPFLHLLFLQFGERELHVAIVFGCRVTDLETQADGTPQQRGGLEQAMEREGTLFLERTDAVETGE